MAKKKAETKEAGPNDKQSVFKGGKLVHEGKPPTKKSSKKKK